MTSITSLTDGVKGKIIRFTWRDGPTKGAIHEHAFHPDGTVMWKDAQGDGKSKPGAPADRPRYWEEGIATGIRLVSYLAASGYTLTVVLNEESGLIAGIASNEKNWVPVHGSYEVVSSR
jgi:hypothetical protein